MQLKILAILSLLFFTSCKDDIPVTHEMVPFPSRGFVQDFIIQDTSTFNLVEGKQLPMNAVEGAFCLEPKEYLAFKKWYLRQQNPNPQSNNYNSNPNRE